MLMAVVMVGMSAAAQAQLTGIRDKIQNRLDQAQQERDQAAQNAGVEAPGAVKDAVGWVTRIAADGTKVRLYVAHPFMKPGDTPKLPAVVLLHEWWGLNDDIVQRTEEFAGKGYYAVAVDLYDGKVTKDPAEAAKYKDALTDAGALARMKAGLDVLTALAGKGGVDAGRIAAAGWRMGGNQSLKLALGDARVKACVVFYGTPITEAAKLKALQGPVLGIFGKEDKGIPVAQVDAFEKGLKEAGIKAEILQYDGVGHAFASKAAAAMGMYNEAKAKEAWGKMWEWLGKMPASK